MGHRSVITQFLLLFAAISYVHSSCSIVDQASLFIIATDLMACLDITQDMLSDLIDEFNEIKDFDFSTFKNELEVCQAIDCGDDFLCFDKIDCVNDILTNLDFPDFSASDDLLTVIFNFCDCYTILEDIPPDCEDYIDGLVGFHVPVEEMIEAGDTTCSQVDVACDGVETFLNDCVDLQDSTIEDLCDYYASIIENGDTTSSDGVCAAEMMTLVLLPSSVVDAVETACELSTVYMDLIDVARDNCEFDVFPPSPTSMPIAQAPSSSPTIGPTAQDAVSIEVQFSFSLDASTPISQATLQSVLATELDVAEKDIRQFTLTSTSSSTSTTRRVILSSSEYLVICLVVSSLSESGSSSEASLTETFEYLISGSSFETALSSSLGTTVIVTSTSTTISTPQPIPQPTSSPVVSDGSSPSSSSSTNDAVLGASLSITAVFLIGGIVAAWFFYKQKGGFKKFGSYMATEEEQEVEMQPNATTTTMSMNPTPVSQSMVGDSSNDDSGKSYGGVMNPAWEEEEEVDLSVPKTMNTSVNEPTEGGSHLVESDGSAAWF